MSLRAERNIPSKSKDYGKNTCKCRGKNVNLRLKMNISSLSKYDMIADKYNHAHKTVCASFRFELYAGFPIC